MKSPMRIITRTVLTAAALLAGAACLFPLPAVAGSCCGGSAAAALILPKSAKAMIDTSFDLELYDGFWDQDGQYRQDPAGTDIRQYRLNLGYAQRLSKRWQASASVPYIWNTNRYSGLYSSSEGVGDTAFGLWYEASDTNMCRWGAFEVADLIPAATLGLSLTVPTGISPYDDSKSSFDITGRGFYRLDANVLLDKTIYPWSASLLMSYGTHLDRMVNREYGEYVEPYRKRLGDRAAATLAASYQHFLDIRDSRSIMTYTAALAEIVEQKSTINGDRDATTGFQKSSLAGTVAWSTLTRNWKIKATWNHSILYDGWGANFPASDIYSLGVSHVFE